VYKKIELKPGAHLREKSSTVAYNEPNYYFYEITSLNKKNFDNLHVFSVLTYKILFKKFFVLFYKSQL